MRVATVEGNVTFFFESTCFLLKVGYVIDIAREKANQNTGADNGKDRQDHRKSLCSADTPRG